jgi:hypothetical protein
MMRREQGRRPSTGPSPAEPSDQTSRASATSWRPSRRCAARGVDGLGHGRGRGGERRGGPLEAHRDEPVIDLVQRCHAALAATRGVVMSLASYDALDRTLTWIGVGNAEGIVLRADRRADPSRQTLLLRGGVVGYQLPELHASVVAVSPGDTLVLAPTASRRFRLAPRPRRPAPPDRRSRPRPARQHAGRRPRPRGPLRRSRTVRERQVGLARAYAALSEPGGRRGGTPARLSGGSRCAHRTWASSKNARCQRARHRWEAPHTTTPVRRAAPRFFAGRWPR